jgi:hypothetical protein
LRKFFLTFCTIKSNTKISFLVQNKNYDTTHRIVRSIYRKFGKEVVVIAVDKSDPKHRK